jgi:hypothetical protein
MECYVRLEPCEDEPWLFWGRLNVINALMLELPG